MSLFNPDSEFWSAVGKCADYVLLNILCLLFMLPIVTAGAAMTAKYYVAMKIERGEEPVLWRSFWGSFRKNFKQTTIVWMIYFFVLVFLAADWRWVIESGRLHSGSLFPWLLLIVSVITAGSMLCVFPMLARFHMKTKEAIRGAVMLTVMKLPRVLLMIFLVVIPYIIGAWYIEWFLAIWFFITGVALYYNSKMFVKEFKKIEGEEEPEDPDAFISGL